MLRCVGDQQEILFLYYTLIIHRVCESSRLYENNEKIYNNKEYSNEKK